MDEKFEQYVSAAKKIALDKDEKLRIRNFLSQYAAMRPVTKGSEDRHLSWRGPENRIGLLPLMRSLFLKPMPVIIIIALLLGGSSSFAAEHALPGDVLYPVK